MLLMILWFSTIFNTCNKDKTSNENTEMSESVSDTSEVFEDLGDDFFEDDETASDDDAIFSDTPAEQNLGVQKTGTTQTESEDVFSDSEDYNDYTGNATTPAPAKSVKSQSNSNSGSAGENASYLIVAGSFLVEANANQMKNKLKGWGYSAEVRNFNFSQYYSVIAGRYNSKSDADRKAGDLKAKGINCYVQKRKL